MGGLELGRPELERTIGTPEIFLKSCIPGRVHSCCAWGSRWTGDIHNGEGASPRRGHHRLIPRVNGIHTRPVRVLTAPGLTIVSRTASDEDPAILVRRADAIHLGAGVS